MIPDLFKIFEINPAADKFKSGNAEGITAIISAGLNIAILIASALTLFWLFWGAFQYILAGGKKEELAKAKSRMSWAVIGLIITMLAFLVAQYASQIFTPQNGVPF